MEQGKLVILAGGEGSGKSTCALRLQEMLPGESFVFTREPGGTELAETVRNVFLGNELPVYEQLLAVELARAIHFREKVLPALEAGTHVICDRCSEATWAYQIVAGEADLTLRGLFAKLDNLSRAGREIDLWIDFQIDSEVALARRHAAGKSLDVFDRKPSEYHRRVRAGLDEYFQLHDGRVQAVDATLAEEALAEAVYAIICRFTGISVEGGVLCS